MSSLKNALKGLKRNFSMASASMLLVFFTLIVLGSVIIIGVNAQKVSSNILDSISVYAYLNKGITEEQVKIVSEEAKNIQHIDSVTFSTPDEELVDILGYFGENANAIQENFSGVDNPLLPTLEMSVDNSVEDLQPVLDQVKKIEGVGSVSESSARSLKNLVQTITIAQYIGLALGLLLLSVSLFIITNTIRLAITARKKEIEIMRLVGATKNYIRMPFILEGLIIGLVGGFFASLILIGGYYQAISTKSGQLYTQYLVPFKTVALYLIGSLILFGIVIGVLGSLLALRKHLKR